MVIAGPQPRQQGGGQPPAGGRRRRWAAPWAGCALRLSEFGWRSLFCTTTRADGNAETRRAGGSWTRAARGRLHSLQTDQGDGVAADQGDRGPVEQGKALHLSAWRVGSARSANSAPGGCNDIQQCCTSRLHTHSARRPHLAPVAPLARLGVSAALGSTGKRFAMQHRRQLGRFMPLALLVSPAARPTRPRGRQKHFKSIERCMQRSDAGTSAGRRRCRRRRCRHHRGSLQPAAC